MSPLTTPRTPDRPAAADVGPGGSAPSVLGGQRAPRHVLVGAALMTACALLFGLWALRAEPAVPVLAVARPVAAGQTITEADVRVVRVAPQAGVELVAESDRAMVVGGTARVPLVAGSLLAAGQVGQAGWPPAGQSVVGVPVPAGRMPAGLAAGARVSVLVPTGGSPEPAGLVVSAWVVAAGQPGAAGMSTVSLLMGSVDARAVAAAAEVVLVLESPGGG